MESLLRGAYLALIAWQLIWHSLLPAPLGAGLIWVGLLAMAPLLLTLRGVLRVDHRGINWASYLLLPYFLVAVMEAWSNAPQQVPALVQLGLVCCCLACIGLINRRRSRRARG